MQKHSKNYPKRGEIFIANLDPGFGREIRKKRPILIVSNNVMNKTSATVIMVPLSSIVPELTGPHMVNIEENLGLDKRSVIVIDQIRSIDKERIFKKVGSISAKKLEEVEYTLRLVLGLEPID